MKPPPAVEETYRGVAAPSRPKVGNTAPIEEMPKVCLSTHLPMSVRSSLLYRCLVLLIQYFQERAHRGSTEWQT